MQKKNFKRYQSIVEPCLACDVKPQCGSMSEQPIPNDQQRSPRVYTEEEQRRRWVLIIDAILSDPGQEGRQERWMIAPPSTPQSNRPSEMLPAIDEAAAHEFRRSGVSRSAQLVLLHWWYTTRQDAGGL